MSVATNTSVSESRNVRVSEDVWRALRMTAAETGERVQGVTDRLLREGLLRAAAERKAGGAGVPRANGAGAGKELTYEPDEE